MQESFITVITQIDHAIYGTLPLVHKNLASAPVYRWQLHPSHFLDPQPARCDAGLLL
jgi:hypothetical protein